MSIRFAVIMILGWNLLSRTVLGAPDGNGSDSSSASLPPCVAGCIGESVPGHEDCPQSDFNGLMACACTKNNLVATIFQCIVENCPDEVQVAEGLFTQRCGASVSTVFPLPSGVPSTGTVSLSSEMTASTTSASTGASTTSSDASSSTQGGHSDSSSASTSFSTRSDSTTTTSSSSETHSLTTITVKPLTATVPTSSLPSSLLTDAAAGSSGVVNSTSLPFVPPSGTIASQVSLPAKTNNAAVSLGALPVSRCAFAFALLVTLSAVL